MITALLTAKTETMGDESLSVTNIDPEKNELLPTLNLKFKLDESGARIWPPKIGLTGFVWDDTSEFEYVCFPRESVYQIWICEFGTVVSHPEENGDCAGCGGRQDLRGCGWRWITDE